MVFAAAAWTRFTSSESFLCFSRNSFAASMSFMNATSALRASRLSISCARASDVPPVTSFSVRIVGIRPSSAS